MEQSQRPSYTFYIDPYELTHRFDALLDRHLPPAADAMHHRRVPSLCQAKSALIECKAELDELRRQSNAGDVVRRQQRLAGLLDELTSDGRSVKIARLVRRRRRKRQRARELRQQRMADRQRCDDRYERDLLAAGRPNDAAERAAERQSSPVAEVARNAMPTGRRPKTAQNYAVLLDRLAELHRVRCQQATRSPSSAFIAELQALRQQWTNADE